MSKETYFSAIAQVFTNRIAVALGTKSCAIFSALVFSLAITPTMVSADFGSSPGTSCASGYRWCAKKNKCVHALCKRGRAWSSSRCSCVRSSSDLVSDEDLLTEAVVLAKHERFSEALDLLNRIKNRDQAPVLNYIGYTTRKLGRIDEGIVYYQKALAIDPDYTLAREYLGEGLLTRGDLEGAKRQLAEISKRCGNTCHEYEELFEEIRNYEAESK